MLSNRAIRSDLKLDFEAISRLCERRKFRGLNSRLVKQNLFRIFERPAVELHRDGGAALPAARQQVVHHVLRVAKKRAGGQEGQKRAFRDAELAHALTRSDLRLPCRPARYRWA